MRLICWASQLAKLVTEVVVLLALVHKSKHYVIELWKEEEDENDAAATSAQQSTPNHPTRPTHPSTDPLRSPSAKATTTMIPSLSWPWLCSQSSGGVCGGGGAVAPSHTKALSLAAASHQPQNNSVEQLSRKQSSSHIPDNDQPSSPKIRRIGSNHSARSVRSITSLSNVLKRADSIKNNFSPPPAEPLLPLHQVLSTALAAVERSLEAQLMLLYKGT